MNKRSYVGEGEGVGIPLSYTNPVTISWRPRHAKIIAAHENYTDAAYTPQMVL